MTLPYRLRTGLVRVGGLVLFVLALPFNLAVAWPALLAFRALGLVRDLGWERGGTLVATFTKRWTGQMDTTGRPRRWPWSTTLSHAIAYQERHRAAKGTSETPLQRHEHTHREQAENAALRAFVIAALALGVAGLDEWPLALGIWASSYAHLATNSLAAWMRGRDPYLGSEHEEHARSRERGEP